MLHSFLLCNILADIHMQLQWKHQYIKWKASSALQIPLFKTALQFSHSNLGERQNGEKKKKKVFSLTCIQTQKFSSSTYWYFPNHQNHIIYYSGFISPLPRVSLPTHAHGPLLTMTELPSLTFDLRTNSSCSHLIETTKGK